MIRRCLPKRTPVAPSMARELQEIVDETDDQAHASARLARPRPGSK